MARMFDYKPLERRIYKKRNPVMRFYCPLCSTERYMSSRPRLAPKNYFQLVLTTVFVGLIAYPLMGFRSFYLFFVFWAGMELFVRLRFRKEIPCPHCGFDASWYKRDVKVARKFVDKFWEEKKTDQKQEEEKITIVNPMGASENTSFTEQTY